MFNFDSFSIVSVTCYVRMSNSLCNCWVEGSDLCPSFWQNHVFSTFIAPLSNLESWLRGFVSGFFIVHICHLPFTWYKSSCTLLSEYCLLFYFSSKVICLLTIELIRLHFISLDIVGAVFGILLIFSCWLITPITYAILDLLYPLPPYMLVYIYHIYFLC